MAKVKLPLISLEARGAIGKALVYFPWKGINAVREYVIPANPRTPDQTTQRGYFADAVADLHLSEFTVSDQAAWRAYASIMPKVMTGPNTFIRQHVNHAILGQSWLRIRDMEVDDIQPTYIAYSVESVDTSTLMRTWVTTNPRFPGTVHGMSYNAGTGKWVWTEAPLLSNTIYYIKASQYNGTIFGELAWFKVKTP